MSDEAIDIAEQFEKAIRTPKQTWLLAAGASFMSNIPLMYPLTRRVLALARTEFFKDEDELLSVINFIAGDIEKEAHIEVFLTHLADLISMSTRSRDHTVQLGGEKVSFDTLTQLHHGLLEIISDTIRWGYRENWNEKGELEDPDVGNSENPIVTVKHHLSFVRAVFGQSRAGLEALRGPVEFFTTNYDTLIEDALALCGIPYDDGFSGGGVAFWAGYGRDTSRASKARIIKLHGSIDWVAPKEGASRLLRVRHHDTYPAPKNQVVIYPQSTKYVNTQLDPFAALFQRFRANLADGSERVLLVCGYSFGDEHINQDIEVAMSAPDSQLTLVAFSEEKDALPTILDFWRKSSWGERVYVASTKGLYNGDRGPFWEKDGGRDWWTFDGVTGILSGGLPTDIQEAMA
ncbi:SIR2 family protein [uncultured Cohaesibacter sp.]|uniref:SIR2 family protein n=1 Tax=uncultured Cohaesibacter sp. TaxID=1002546 RepID=UPI00292E86E5|nr:SIR2 family protein [uncultured Cohaesibacter sp.]